MSKNIFLLCLFCLLSFNYVSASEQAIYSFRQLGTISTENLKVPSVVEFKLKGSLENTYVGIFNPKENKFVPSVILKETYEIQNRPVSVFVNGISQERIFDGTQNTYAEIPINDNGEGYASFDIQFNKPITSNAFVLFLDEYSSLPSAVSIKTLDGESPGIALFQKAINSSFVNFPARTAKIWKIELYYSQPIRVSEILLDDIKAVRNDVQLIRFLAQPNYQYFVYADPDRAISLNTEEMPDLMSGSVFSLADVELQENKQYQPSDIDGDRIIDKKDNCVSVTNNDQQDTDNNGVGDACEDYDKDGIANSLDNCPNNTNRNQTDIDGDKIGDVCDKEESRITEKYAWLPWVGLSFVIIIFLMLLVFVTKQKNKK